MEWVVAIGILIAAGIGYLRQEQKKRQAQRATAAEHLSASPTSHSPRDDNA
ncbi:MAG TPA: hypothetical protein VGM83_05410 [Devosiaceae bacterium]|jgi:hypothetical protein